MEERHGQETGMGTGIKEEDENREEKGEGRRGHGLLYGDGLEAQAESIRHCTRQ